MTSLLLNPLPNMPISGSSSSATNKDMMSKIWKMGVQLPAGVENIVGKGGEIALLRAISPFPTMFSKAVCCWCVKMSIYGVKS